MICSHSTWMADPTGKVSSIISTVSEVLERANWGTTALPLSVKDVAEYVSQ